MGVVNGGLPDDDRQPRAIGPIAFFRIGFQSHAKN